MCREVRRDRESRGGRTPSTSARSDTPKEGEGRPTADRTRWPQRPPGSTTSRRSLYCPRNAAERTVHLGDEVVELLRQRRGTADDHECHPIRRRAPSPPPGFTQPTARPISFHRISQLATDRESDLPLALGFAPEHDQGRSIDPLALRKERLKIRAPRQPLPSGERSGQTVSRLRPFARRRFSVFRPPCVFIRSRKPWVLARRRRFG